MALLYMSKPLPLTDLTLWVHPNSKRLESSSIVNGSANVVAEKRIKPSQC
jgi:hypothetical protein